MQTIEIDSSKQKSSSQKPSAIEFLHCNLHEYEQVCFVNIAESIQGSTVRNYKKRLVEADEYSQDDSSSCISDFQDQIHQQDDQRQLHGNQIGNSKKSSHRYLCAECLCEAEDIDKKHLLPLRKLAFNQKRLYTNWPPLTGNLNQKLYNLMSENQDQHAYLNEIDRVCSALEDQFVQIVSQLKKDLMRIEGERFDTIRELEKLYYEISELDKFNSIILQQTYEQQSKSNQVSKQQQQQQQQQQSQQQQQQQQQQQLLQEQLFQEQEQLYEKLEEFNETESCRKEMKIEMFPVVDKNEEIPLQDSSPVATAAISNQGFKLKSGSDLMEQFLEIKYDSKQENSKRLEKILSQLEKFKPLEDHLTGIQEKLTTFANSLKNKQNFIDIQMVKSSFKSSKHLVIGKNQKSEITIHTEGQIWGQVYSNFVLDNKLTYQFKFKFEQEVQNFIIIGLILDTYKDQTSQGSSFHHFGKIFGQENNTYCGQILKGGSQLSFLKRNDVIIMEVCVANNHLIFSDQSGFNVTTLHKDYSLNPTGRYRLCIEFYDFDEENTITILEAKSL